MTFPEYFCKASEMTEIISSSFDCAFIRPAADTYIEWEEVPDVQVEK